MFKLQINVPCHAAKVFFCGSTIAKCCLVYVDIQTVQGKHVDYVVNSGSADTPIRSVSAFLHIREAPSHNHCSRQLRSFVHLRLHCCLACRGCHFQVVIKYNRDVVKMQLQNHNTSPFSPLIHPRMFINFGYIYKFFMAFLLD